ncbi:MAG: DUF2177 family protein [Pseudorhodoplanes sp.]|uniref:DUF2177 family protein n=1 Tax=Pseudorhodoplanes sp. TaxID=1934341 RepID=UPI003D11F4E3
MKRAIILYLATLIVMVPLDFLFLGVLAKDFFKAQVGPALGDVNIVPAAIFYLLYPVGMVIFVSYAAGSDWQHTLLYGALFGLFCYATFDLTALALLKGWTWPATLVDIAWGTFATATSATLGLLIANAIQRQA